MNETMTGRQILLCYRLRYCCWKSARQKPLTFIGPPSTCRSTIWQYRGWARCVYMNISVWIWMRSLFLIRGRHDINKFSQRLSSLLSGCSADTDSWFAFNPGLNICSHIKKPHANTKQPNLYRLNDCGTFGAQIFAYCYRSWICGSVLFTFLYTVLVCVHLVCRECPATLHRRSHQGAFHGWCSLHAFGLWAVGPWKQLFLYVVV